MGTGRCLSTKVHSDLSSAPPESALCLGMVGPGSHLQAILTPRAGIRPVFPGLTSKLLLPTPGTSPCKASRRSSSVFSITPKTGAIAALSSDVSRHGTRSSARGGRAGAVRHVWVKEDNGVSIDYVVKSASASKSEIVRS